MLDMNGLKTHSCMNVEFGHFPYQLLHPLNSRDFCPKPLQNLWVHSSPLRANFVSPLSQRWILRSPVSPFARRRLWNLLSRFSGIVLWRSVGIMISILQRAARPGIGRIRVHVQLDFTDVCRAYSFCLLHSACWHLHVYHCCHLLSVYLSIFPSFSTFLFFTFLFFVHRTCGGSSHCALLILW